MDPKLKPIISFIFPSLLFIGTSIPLIINKIPPNCLYGFRMKKTILNKEIWYKANQYGGRCILSSGLITLIGCIVLLLNKNILSFDIINIYGLGLFLMPLMVSLAATLIYIKKL